MIEKKGKGKKWRRRHVTVLAIAPSGHHAPPCPRRTLSPHCHWPCWMPPPDGRVAVRRHARCATSACPARARRRASQRLARVPPRPTRRLLCLLHMPHAPDVVRLRCATRIVAPLTKRRHAVRCVASRPCPLCASATRRATSMPRSARLRHGASHRQQGETLANPPYFYSTPNRTGQNELGRPTYQFSHKKRGNTESFAKEPSVILKITKEVRG